MPIFLITGEKLGVFYVPGYGVPLDVKRVLEFSDAFRVGGAHCRLPGSDWLGSLVSLAEQAKTNWELPASKPFTPECLTVYLSNQCNLTCSYCYSAKPRGGQTTILREEVASAAVNLVADSCAASGRPLSFVVHGGGEPTLHLDLVRRLVDLTRRAAEKAGVEWTGHIATNGLVSRQDALWLARHFDSIGLSCDGPPDLNDRVRRFRNGRGSSRQIERTAKTLVEAGAHCIARATIIPATATRQVEILSYLAEELGMAEIRFEPAYGLWHDNNRFFRPDDADLFVEHFQLAVRKARSLNVDLLFSGVRLDELHGPYCNLLRNVLHLRPDGSATGCFFSVNGGTTPGRRTTIGWLDEKTGRFILHRERMEALCSRAAAIPTECYDCPCIYHCVRNCPETCYALGEPGKVPGGFRCRVAKMLALSCILEAAAATIETPVEPAPVLLREEVQTEEPRLTKILRSLPSNIDANAIREQWRQARCVSPIDSHELPQPIWAERGFECDGPTAWQVLRNQLSVPVDLPPISIYIHVPFCRRRCPFCDCYSVVSSAAGNRYQKQFEERLLAEMRQWAELPGVEQRPVMTVHFGGGTPNHLAPRVLESILDGCRSCFAVDARTEFALESTSGLLDQQHLAWLTRLGFSRLHVGVQTLEDPVRRLIGRQDEAFAVIQKIGVSLAENFVVSVDLVYGLPGQTLPGFISGIEQLVDAGVHGFSLYQFQVSRRNRRFAERTGGNRREALRDYVLFQSAEQLLTTAGYRKSHFAHFARKPDENLYYRHAVRGEDLLALGPTADGVMGSFHYRHPELLAYLREGESRPPLEGGIWESLTDQHLRPLTASLLAGYIRHDQIRALKLEALITEWVQSGIVIPLPDGETEGYVLSANGSWFIKDLLRQVRGAVVGES